MNSNKHVEAAVPRKPSDGVRVADSSIFPYVTYGNLNGPSIMTGEKAADYILCKQPLVRSNQSRGSTRAGPSATDSQW